MNRIFGKVSIQEKINFVRHLAIVTKSGLPLLESLKIIEEQTESKTLQKIIRQLAVDVNNGHLLSDGLVKHQKTFGDFFISIIRIGELSGTLTTNL
ncbi:MAG: type II secretion system F family protein, partial [Patescibacteria group bacterium]